MVQEPDEPTHTRPRQPGVFIMRGVGVRIPAGGLKVGVDSEGKLAASLTLHLAMDVCPTWLEIAEGHLAAAQATSKQLEEAALHADEQAIAERLERDLRSSMQAVVASSAAIDAFYAVLRGFVPIDEPTKKAWREKGTARYKQVAEIVRRAFQMKPRNAVQLRNALKELYHYRDISVHPDLSFAEAAPHPEAGRSTAKLFATFRYPNARELARVGLSIVAQSCLVAKSPFPDVSKYCEELRPRIVPILDRWEHSHGKVFKRPGDPDNPSTP